MAFAPDGRTILIVDMDKTASLWDVATGKKIGPMPSRRALCPAISPDGVHLAVGGLNGVIALWRTPQPLDGTAERLRVWIELRAGMELDQEDIFRSLRPEALQSRRQRLEELGEPPTLLH